MLDATNILVTIALAVNGWILLEVVSLKTEVARLEQKLDDLPCLECPKPRQPGRSKIVLAPN